MKMVNISSEKLGGVFVLYLPLTIVQTTELADYYEYDACATLDGETLGLIVRLKKNIPAGIVNGEMKNIFLNEGIEFLSKGEPSDKLLNFISKQYGLSYENISLKERQIFTCANLNKKPVYYTKGKTSFKIFLEEGEDVAELFVDFDFSKGVIHLHEKDEGFNEPLIKLMKK